MANSTKISNTSIIESGDQGFQGFIRQDLMTATTTTGSPAAGTFYSSITNRASIQDLSKNLKVQMGIERIPTQSSYQLQNEFGPNSEPVWGVLNDTLGQIRFVGGWNNIVNLSGQYTYSSSTADYMEVTFYGTGLNILMQVDVNARGFSYFVDGGSSNAGSYPAGATGITGGRGYSVNNVLSVVSNLSLGVHTVKVLFNGAFSQSLIMGIEILNESTVLKVNQGTSYLSGKKSVLQQAQDHAVTSGFETGTLGTRGGRVLVYQKSDGTIKKAVQPVDASSLTLTSATHANEEVIRTYHFREFGAGRSDDFSKLTGAQASAFTLDDGTTTLASSNSGWTNPGLAMGGTNGAFTAFTFVGTGLDILRVDNANGGADTFTVSIDGATPITLSTTGSTIQRVQKIVSGLPYGTHTVKFTRTSAPTTYDAEIINLIVYGPKKPTLPSGAVELADYNIMADFVANTTQSAYNLATGIIRKSNAREFVYTGTQSISLDSGGSSGTIVFGQGTASYTFFGTGFDLRLYGQAGGASTYTLTVDGAANMSAFTTGFYGSITSYNSTSGLISQATAAGNPGCGVYISGLTLGMHTVKIAYTSGTGNVNLDCLDIITPIHSPKSNLYADLQDTLPIGSCGISDNRQFTPIKTALPTTKAYVEAVNVGGWSSSGTTFLPITDMSAVIRLSSNTRIEVNFSGGFYNSSQAGVQSFACFVDGVQVGPSFLHQFPAGTLANEVSFTKIISLSKGIHIVQIMGSSSSGTMTASSGRVLTVKEL